MKIGFPNHPRKNIIEEIEWIGKNGFDFVDLFLEEDQAVPEKIDVGKLKQLFKNYNLDVVGHTAWYLPIGSPIKFLRETAIKELIRYFEVFNKLGVEFVTIHAHWPGIIFSPKEGVIFQIESLRKLVKEAEKYNLKLMYEPIDTFNDNVENISIILEEIPELFFHLDIGHANLFNRKPEEFIEKFHQKLRHLHLHDNFGKEDLHLPLGCGIINWERLLKILKKYYDGTITLEIFSKDRNNVLMSKEKLKELWQKI
ncbi:MAG: sugar phosphate isomerase/epimerase [Patescibacteria group bacterium]|nr:sugar phosphate isomerase/epimerase [Patescibacteria group bacterium]